MTRRTTNGKTKLAVSEQGTGRAETEDNQSEIRPGVLGSAEGIRGAAADGAEAEPGDSNQDIPSDGRTDTSEPATDTVPQTRRETSKRLTKSAVARLRGEDKPEYEADPPIMNDSIKDMSVGELQEMYEAERTTNEAAIRNYRNGYRVGYDAGKVDQQEIQRQEREAAEVEPGRIWKYTTTGLASAIAGLIAGLVLSGL
jgi:hypothetical protein